MFIRFQVSLRIRQQTWTAIEKAIPIRKAGLLETEFGSCCAPEAGW
jgi:hypothetical protein